MSMDDELVTSQVELERGYHSADIRKHRVGNLGSYHTCLTGCMGYY